MLISRRRKIQAADIMTVLFMVLFPLMLMAQSEKEDVVYLKNGSMLRGQIIEGPDGYTLRIKTYGDNILRVKMEDVLKIKCRGRATDKSRQKTGYAIYTGIDILPGRSTTTVRIQMINGYRFTPDFSVGIGLGYVPYNDPLGLIPVFLAGRYTLLERGISPFVILRTGYGISVLTDEDRPVESHHGGLMFNPGMGIRIKTGAGFTWAFTAGMSIDKSSFEQRGWNNQRVETEIVYRRVQFGIELSF